MQRRCFLSMEPEYYHHGQAMEVDDDDGALVSPLLGKVSLDGANIRNKALSMEGNDDGGLDTRLVHECADRVNQDWSP